MEEYQIESETKEIENKITETLIIEQNEKKYKLELVIEGEIIFLNLYEEGNINNKFYSQKLSLREIKNKHQIFCVFKTCKEFLDYIKALYENKKLSIKINNESFSLLMNIEYLFKQQIIEIPLEKNKIKIQDLTDDIIKEISFLKNTIKLQNENIGKINSNLLSQNMEINYLKEENAKLKEEIKQFKEIFGEKIIYEQITSFSNILKYNECELIFSAIKKRMYRKIKNIKKIYLAAKDGRDPSIFHSKCDGINNTLVLIHSNGNKRFGGFTSNIWESTSNEVFKDDKNAFVFSLDKQKIYSYKNDGKAIRCHKNYGPCFGCVPEIGIFGNPHQPLLPPATSQCSTSKFTIPSMSNNIVDSTPKMASTKRIYPVATSKMYNNKSYNAGKQVRVVSYNNINSYNTLGQGQSVSYNDNSSYDIDYSFLEDTLDSVIDYEVFQVIFE